LCSGLSLWPCGQRCECHPESADLADSRPPTLATQSRELLLLHNHLLISPLSAWKLLHPLPIVISYPSSSHCPSSSQRIISNRHFPRPTSLFVDGTPCLHHSYLLFSSRLIFPYWLVTFDHVHAACTHLNLVYLYQPIVIGEAFRLFVILVLLALPCLKLLDSLRHHLPHLA
jgi:hypothetical protein